MAIEATAATVWDITYQLRLRYPSVPSALPPDHYMNYDPYDQVNKSIYYADDPMVPVLLPTWLKAYDPHTNWWVSRAISSGYYIGAHTPHAIPVFPTDELWAPGYVYSGVRAVTGIPYTLTVVGVRCQLQFSTGVIPSGDLPATSLRIEHPKGLPPVSYAVGHGDAGSTEYGLILEVTDPSYTSTDLTAASPALISNSGFGSTPVTDERFVFVYGGEYGGMPTDPVGDLDLVQMIREWGTTPPVALLESAGEASSGVTMRVSAMPATPELAMHVADMVGPVIMPVRHPILEGMDE